MPTRTRAAAATTGPCVACAHSDASSANSKVPVAEDAEQGSHELSAPSEVVAAARAQSEACIARMKIPAVDAEWMTQPSPPGFAEEGPLHLSPNEGGPAARAQSHACDARRKLPEAEVVVEEGPGVPRRSPPEELGRGGSCVAGSDAAGDGGGRPAPPLDAEAATACPAARRAAAARWARTAACTAFDAWAENAAAAGSRARRAEEEAAAAAITAAAALGRRGARASRIPTISAAP